MEWTTRLCSAHVFIWATNTHRPSTALHFSFPLISQPMVTPWRFYIYRTLLACQPRSVSMVMPTRRPLSPPPSEQPPHGQSCPLSIYSLHCRQIDFLKLKIWISHWLAWQVTKCHKLRGATKIYSLTALKVRSLQSRHWLCYSLWGLWGAGLFHASLLGLQATRWSLPCMFLCPNFPFYEDTSYVGLGSTLITSF